MIDKFYKLNLNRILWLLSGVAVVVLVIFLVWFFEGTTIEVFNPGPTKPKSVITGAECENASKRPVGVMLAGDAEVRPLSGFSGADMVFEMPVSINGIVRFMAIYQCNEPKEIGSVRSSRADFIPLAGAMRVIYGHWGGEKDTLAKLNAHTLDNVDAMKYEGTVYYRKKGVPAPHDGFTNLDNIYKQAEKLGYSMENKFEGYPHQDEIPSKNLANIVDRVVVSRAVPWNSEWKYNSASNNYARWRGGTPEIDRNTGQQVTASVVVLMKTTSTFNYDQYINVNMVGEGDVSVYQNGQLVTGKWKKDSKLDSKIYFYDDRGKEIKFAVGNIWVQVLTNHY